MSHGRTVLKRYHFFMAGRVKFYILSILSFQVIAIMTYIVIRYHKLPVYTYPELKSINVNSTSIDHDANTMIERPPEVFQSIDNEEAWLYSAFYDHVAAQSGKPLVRIFGVTKRKLAQKIVCTFNISGNQLTSQGVITIMVGEHSVNYPPSFLECPLSGNVLPTHVSVSFKSTQKSTNLLLILYPGPRIRNFTVCYSVLHSRFNMATQLIQSIEMNRILGAEHFLVYNYSISPEVDQILRQYQDDGLVTVYQWPIPTNESWYFAQMTALNDCFYRNRNTSRFVVVVDTDELIIPKNHLTWMELIHNVSPHEPDVSKFMNAANFSNNKNIQNGCFSVKSSFFHLNSTPHWNSLPPHISFMENEKENSMKYNIVILSQIMRNKEIFPHTVRSKYIARPELVYVSGVHEVHSFTSWRKCLNINEGTALTHHYRITNNDAGVGETSALKFKDKLYPRFMKEIERFPNLFQNSLTNRSVVTA